MKTTILATTVLLALAAVGTARSAEAAPINIAPAALVTFADFDADRSALFHTVKKSKKGHRGNRSHRSNRGADRNRSRNRNARTRGYDRNGFRNGFNRDHQRQFHHNGQRQTFGLFELFFGSKK